MKKSSLTINTFKYLCIFACALLLLVWVLQIELLQVFYEIHSIEQIQGIANRISHDENYESKLDEYAYENNICIQYYKDNTITGYNTKPSRCILNSKNEEVKEIKNDLITSNKSFVKLTSPKGKIRNVIYKVDLGSNRYVLLNTTLEDMDSAVNQLRHQLIYLILLFMIGTFVVSIFLSRNINKPIMKLIESSTSLGKGDFDVKFEKSNIKELDELADVLTVAASEMNKTDELRRSLISNVSHDLKTPLTMIRAYAEKVRDITYKAPEKRETDLNIIISETERLNNLVNDILDLSKMEDGSEDLKLETYDLVSEIKEIIKRYDIIKDENYNIELDLPKKALILADKSKLNQVIYNLINNAIEHTGDDLLVKITVKKQKDGYKVSIKDTGKGIPEEEIPLVWNRYYKKDKKHKRNIVGTGIGLSIVKGILEQHDFEYGIKSEINKYTEVYFIAK